MADLRTRFATLDAVPAPDLWADIERRAAAGAGADKPIRVVGLRPAWRGPDQTPATTSRAVLVLVLLGLLVVALLGAALVGGLWPEQHAELPVATATHSAPVVDASPTPRETPPGVPVLSGEPFVSARYGYSIRTPEEWQPMTPASETWTGPGPWRPGELDTFARKDRADVSFDIAAHLIPAGMDPPTFLATFVSAQTEAELDQSCGYSGGPILGPYIGAAGPRWFDIHGRPDPTWARGGCDRIDAVVFREDVAYVMTLRGMRMQLRPFEELLIAVDFDHPGPPVSFVSDSDGRAIDPPAPPTGFRSTRYIYGLGVPGGWTATPATESWSGSGRPASTAADTFVGPQSMGSPRLTVGAQTLPKGTSEDRFAAVSTPLPAAVRVDGPKVSCAFGDSFIERGPVPSVWDVDVIGGHRARVRAMCGTVDAVVFVGNRGYLFTLESGQSTTGDLERFHEITASIRFDDGLVRFVSDAYGYSLRYPRGWEVTPATSPWDGGSEGDGIDSFTRGTDRPFARFGVAARPLAPGQAEDEWVSTYVPRIKELFGTTCRFGPVHLLAPEADASWQSATIDGRSARVRAACGRVDGVVFSEGIGYWLRLSTPERRTGADRVAFDELADTIDFDAVSSTFVQVAGVPAGPTKTFSSARYGYTIKIPADWKVARSTKRWNRAGPWVAKMADRFAEPLEVPRRFSVTARPMRGHVLDEAWLAAYVPDPSAVRGTICRNADGTPKSIWRYVMAYGGATWREAVVAGRPARMRGLCGQVQAVLQVGDTAFVLTSFRSDTDEWAFRAIADTFRTSP